MMSGDEFFLPLPGLQIHWTGFTLVVPSVSVANVPQLAVDLLINALLLRNEAQLVGRIRTPCFKPITGPNSYDIFSLHPSSSCEVYLSHVNKLVVLQIRTPPYPETSALVAQTLSDWIQGQKFGRTVVLSSSFSQCLPDPDLEISGRTIKFMVTAVAAAVESELEKTGTRRLIRPDAANSPTESVPTQSLRLPGSGFGLRLFRELEDRGRDAVLLVSFCSEGDNRPEAESLIELLGSALLGIECKRWEAPVSWIEMFGSGMRSDIF